MSRWGRPVERQHSSVQVGRGLGSSSPDSRWFQNLPIAHLSMQYQCTKNSESLEEMADFNFYFHFIQFIQQFILQFIHSPHWIDLFSSSPQIWPFSSYHLIKEAKIGSEVVGADEENILSRSRSSGQKWEAAWGGEKQEKSLFLFQHLKYSNLDMNVIFLSHIATECEVAVVAVGGEKQGKSNFLRLIWEGFPAVCFEKVFAVYSEKVVCHLLWEGFLHVYSEKVFCSEKVFRHLLWEGLKASVPKVSVGPDKQRSPMLISPSPSFNC